MTAVEQARERQQLTREQRRGGSIVFNGTTYQGGALYLGPLEQVPKRDGSGWVSMQRFTIHIRKSLMPVPPAKKQTFTACGHTWRCDEVAGQSPVDIAWHIKAIRFPDPP